MTKIHIKNRVLSVLSRPSQIIPFIRSSKTVGIRFFRHPIFFILKCLNILLVFIPIWALVYFAGNKFLQPENVFFLNLILAFMMLTVSVSYYVFHQLNSYLLVPKEGLYIFSASGIFSLNREQIPFDKVGVSDLQRKGFWPHVLNFGDLLLSSVITARQGTVPRIVLSNIYNPEFVLTKIKEMNKSEKEKTPEMQRPITENITPEPEVQESITY